MPIRITGLNSGLDTEALVSELVSAYRTKSQKYVKAQKKLSWKQEIWSSLNSKVSSFYSSITSLKYSAAYNLRTATVSDTTKASVSATSSAVNGTYTLKIAKTAKTGYLTGAELDDTISENSSLADLGYTGGDGTISVISGGKTTDISVNSGTKISDFVSQLNEAGVKASFDAVNHRIYVTSSETGVKNDFSLSGSDGNGMDALSKLGLSVKSTADTENYKKMAAYALNTNGTAYITGYNADGTAITDGTYDEAKTRDNITNILSGLTDSSTTITNNAAQIEYAKAFQTVSDVNKNLSDQDIKTMQALLKEKDTSDIYVDRNGELYDRLTDGTFTRRSDNVNYSVDELAANGLDLQMGATRLVEWEADAGLAKKEVGDDGSISYTVDASAVSAYTNGLTTISVYEQEAENADEVTAVQDAYNNGTLDTLKTDLQNEVDSAKSFVSAHSIWDNPSYTADSVTNKITNAAQIMDGTTSVSYSAGATRVNGEDATIVVNNATYTSSSNTFNINGLTINALAATGMDDDDEISITIANNTQGLYDKIKSFLKEYNTLINEITSLYNASTAKGLEPLTNEEKDAMTDTEVEEWEKKIKESLLRRDSSLESLMSGMTNAMMKSFSINGKNYSLSSFGIKTLGVLNAKENEENAFHIDGDSEDSVVSGKTDLLMAALNNDPDTVVEFMKQLTTGLYDNISQKMKSNKLSSFNKVYNDKEMAQEYSDYTTTINKWEEKLAAIEDSYYKKFAAMESALATLQSQQSSLASLLG